jgi:hypothetical protein
LEAEPVYTCANQFPLAGLCITRIIIFN